LIDNHNPVRQLRGLATSSYHFQSPAIKHFIQWTQHKKIPRSRSVSIRAPDNRLFFPDHKDMFPITVCTWVCAHVCGTML